MIPRFRVPRAFSLLEILAAIGVMTLLAAITIPALNSLQSSYHLNEATQSVLGQLTSARQEALASNRAVQVRFYKIKAPDGSQAYRAVQSLRETTDSSGNLTVHPITKPYFLPKEMQMVENSTGVAVSTLFATSGSGAVASSGDPAHPLPSPDGAAPYVCFRFRPNGRTDLADTSSVTIASRTAPIAANQLPKNFVTLQIDPVNGSVRTYRP